MNLDEARYKNNAKDQVKKWSDFLRKTREYLYQKGYQEVSTSSLVTTGAFESTIDPLHVTGEKESWQLHTSPEMEMKRLISQAKTDIFQITKCFRDDPDTGIHGKEFTMLEFYKMGDDYNAIIEETKNLFKAAISRDILFKEITVEVLFLEILGFNLSHYPTKVGLGQHIKDKNILQAEASDSWEDLFFKLMIEKIEPALDPKIAYIVKDYPTVTSVLSKQIANSPYSERFEIYWQGMELCNGCTEITVFEDLQRNFEAENKKRLDVQKKPHPLPDAFFSAMKEFPKCSGIAVGLDRLFLCKLFST